MVLNKKIIKFTLLVFLSFLYLYLRVNFRETIEFGHDQPKIISAAVSVMEQGRYLDAMDDVYLSPYGQRSWFSLFLYFFMPLLVISKDPVMISLMIALYNGLGLIVTYFLGKKLFGERVAFLGVFLMIVSPWHVIFSRMIYNPSVSLTTIIVGYYLIVLIREGKKWPWYFLPLSLGAIVQVYMISGAGSVFAILILTFLFLRKNVDYKRLFLGIIIGFIIWIPVVRYDFMHNHEEITRLFTPSRLWEDKTYLQRGSEVVLSYLNNSSYSDFHFQLGYAHEDFIKSLPAVYKYWMIGFFGLVSVSLIYLISRVILTRKFSYAVIFFWILAPLALLTIYKIPGILPRYFWVVIPPTCLIVSDFVLKASEFLLKRRANALIIPFAFLTFVLNTNFVLRYFDFVMSYSGYRTFLSPVSDPPIAFMLRAYDYAQSDARGRGFDGASISTDMNIKGGEDPSWNDSYLWKYVLGGGKSGVYENQLHYVIKGGETPEGISDAVRFGPYVVFPIYE